MLEFLELFMHMHTVSKMIYVSYFVITLDLPTNKKTLLAKKNKILIFVDAKLQDATILI